VVVPALSGALGFLSRLPVGTTSRSWNQFRGSPYAFVLAGYLIGALLALPLLVPAPQLTTGFAFLVGVYLLTGVTHIDGVADLGDALVVHGDVSARRDVLEDSDVGAGGALALALVVFGLGAAGTALASLGLRAILLVITAEVGAKLAMAVLVCVGSPAHEGLGSKFTRTASPRAVLPVLLVALPAAFLSWPRVAPAGLALSSAVLSALGMLVLARRTVGGVSGDIVGATNEISRIVALHVGVVAWTQL